MSFLGWRVGLPDHSQPYEITALQFNTTADQIDFQSIGATYEFTTEMQITIMAKRLPGATNVDPQLGNMEREVQRLICQAVPGDISENVREVIYLGQERIYNANDTYAKSEWRTLVRVLLKIYIQNPDTG